MTRIYKMSKSSEDRIKYEAAFKVRKEGAREAARERGRPVSMGKGLELLNQFYELPHSNDSWDQHPPWGVA